MYCDRCGFRLEEHHFACPICFPHTRSKPGTVDLPRVDPTPAPVASAGPPRVEATERRPTPVPVVAAHRAPAPVVHPLPAEARSVPPAAPTLARPVRARSGLGALRSLGLGFVTLLGIFVLGRVLTMPVTPLWNASGGSVSNYAAATFVAGLALVGLGRLLWHAPRRRGLYASMLVAGPLGWLGFGPVLIDGVTTSRPLAALYATALVGATAFVLAIVAASVGYNDRRRARSFVAGILAGAGVAAVLVGLHALAIAPQLQEYADGRATPAAGVLALLAVVGASAWARRPQRS